ncbi:Translation initiation factor 2 subunit alpha [Candidatus Lokiarchaeum ossiferum]|uniref:Translation initiation factor 2 subunit alpha n=1 Tax=Candidatus Lokiarchaeum ossiferum TaxID=2951803 RepID=A0ABY6HP23_9ARCH|nr:Translation initiation factor 2 subunit alpha [Candidatus Lokiarchaeum sp. B-35]
MLNRNPFPTPGEVVVCRVTNVQRGYVQVELEDYTGLAHEQRAQGMIHISELSNRWVKNINSIIANGQRVVLSVLRVNEDRGYLDLSLRRVNKVQKQNIMNSWRYENKLEGLLKFFAEQNKIEMSELFDKAIWPLVDKYGDLHTAFEEIKEEGKDELLKVEEIDIPEDLMESLYQLIVDNVTISKVNMTVEYDVRSQDGNGIELIKEAFRGAGKLRKAKGIETEFTYIGAPIYRLELEAKDYQSAEKHLAKITAKIENVIGSNGSVEVMRDNLSNKQ